MSLVPEKHWKKRLTFRRKATIKDSTSLQRVTEKTLPMMLYDVKKASLP